MSVATSLQAANEPTLSLEMRAFAEAVADLVMARLEARLPKKAARGSDARLLSLTQAAKRLGVSRNDALHELIDERKLKTVTVRGRQKVPVSEIERIEREGTTQVASSQRRRLAIGSNDAPLGVDEAR